MKPFDAPYFVWLIFDLTDKVSRMGKVRGEPAESDEGWLVTFLDTRANQCEEAGLLLSADFLRSLKATVLSRKVDFSFGELGIHLYEFEQQLIREMRRKTFLRLEGEEPEYFEGLKPNWDRATELFPAIRDDAVEGGKCFALGRYTAAVFHMMRVLEVGLNGLADELGVSSQQRNWENIINDLENRIRAIPHSDPHRKPKEHFYASAALHFRFLKDAWRNYVMHTRESYDEGTALSVLFHTAEFMQQLAAERPWVQP